MAPAPYSCWDLTCTCLTFIAGSEKAGVCARAGEPGGASLAEIVEVVGVLLGVGTTRRAGFYA